MARSMKKTAADRPMSNRMKRRIIIACGFLGIFLLYILSNMFSISIVHAKKYKDFAAQQQVSTVTINANRGTIYDRNQKVLASSATVWTVVIAPANMKEAFDLLVKGEKQRLKDDDPSNDQDGNPELLAMSLDDFKAQVAKDLATLLEGDYEKIYAQTQKDNKYEIIKKQVEKPIADQVRNMISEKGYTFISLLEDTKRFYEDSTLASQVIGFTNADNEGTYGVEQYYDDILQGISGKVVTATDAKGNTIPTNYEKRYAPQDGKSIVLTLDSTIQYYAQKALKEVVAQHQPKGGACAIVMNVNTGEILAMANEPTFDLENPRDIYSEMLQEMLENPTETDSEGKEISITLTEEEKTELKQNLLYQQWANKCISWSYEPGSVFKVVTASGALETGAATLHSSYTCSGHITVSGVRMNCDRKTGHGVLDFVGALVNSCNPSFVEMGLAMGADHFYEYLKMFGLTEQTGVDLPGETYTNYYTAEEMGPVELASSSFGQTTVVTPLHMLTSVAAAINGGYLVQPHILKEVLDQEGNVVDSTDTRVKRQVISQETSEQIALAMEQVVSKNGGTAAYVKGYRIGGKSGTAQKGNKDGVYIASYAAFAPVDDPEIAVIVVVDEPSQGVYYGSLIAAPAVGSIMSDVLPYLGYSPEYSEEDLESMGTSVPNVVGEGILNAKSDLNKLGISYEVVGDGDDIVDQMPKRGATITSDSKVILYTEKNTEKKKVTVPDVIGESLNAAMAKLIHAGLTVQLDGANVSESVGTIIVTGQSVKEGQEVERGTTVSITYSRQEEN